MHGEGVGVGGIWRRTIHGRDGAAPARRERRHLPENVPRGEDVIGDVFGD
jgi:hypothetical protein